MQMPLLSLRRPFQQERSERVPGPRVVQAEEGQGVLDGQVPEAPFVGVAVNGFKFGVQADFLRIFLEFQESPVEHVVFPCGKVQAGQFPCFAFSPAMRQVFS